MNESALNGSALGPLEEGPLCEHPQGPFMHTRLYLVAGFGSAVALLGAAQNCLLLSLLLGRRRRAYCHSPYFYLAFLAVNDVFIAVSYIELMTIKILMDYTSWFKLMKLWYTFLVPVLSLSHVATTFSAFLILVATGERYLDTAGSRWAAVVKRNRLVGVLFSFVVGVVVKGTIALEMQVVFREECAGTVGELMLYPSEDNAVISSYYYKHYYMFWFRNTTSKLLPFFALLVLNYAIVSSLKRRAAQAVSAPAAPHVPSSSSFLFSSVISNAALHRSHHMVQVKTATRMLITIVAVYLCGNLLDVVLTAWEFVDSDSLYTDEYLAFYSFATDCVTLLTICVTALRLPIYATYDHKLRRHLKDALAALCFCWPRAETELFV